MFRLSILSVFILALGLAQDSKIPAPQSTLPATAAKPAAATPGPVAIAIDKRAELWELRARMSDLNAQFETLSKQQAEMKIAQASLQAQYARLNLTMDEQVAILAKAAPKGYTFNRDLLHYAPEEKQAEVVTAPPVVAAKAPIPPTAGEKKSKE